MSGRPHVMTSTHTSNPLSKKIARGRKSLHETLFAIQKESDRY